MGLEEISLSFWDLLAPYTLAIWSLIFIVMIKDSAMMIAKGVLFKFLSGFKEGEEFYLDGEKAILVKIGFRVTVFGISNGRGYVWRYVDNDKLGGLKLEKLISKSVHNSKGE